MTAATIHSASPPGALALALVSTFVTVGCGGGAVEPVAPSPTLGTTHTGTTVEPPTPIDHGPRVTFHMHRRMQELAQVERALVAGRLADARAFGFSLSHAPRDPGLPDEDAGRVSSAAAALANARTLTEACLLDGRLAATCASCHSRTREFEANLPPIGAAPAGGGHAWAAARLREGVVGGTAERWRAGLGAFAAEQPDGEAGRRMQTLARDALDADRRGFGDRGATYGEVLVLCARCHAR